MQKEFMGDLELQNTKDQTSSEKKEQKKTFTNLFPAVSSLKNTKISHPMMTKVTSNKIILKQWMNK